MKLRRSFLMQNKYRQCHNNNHDDDNNNNINKNMKMCNEE